MAEYEPHPELQLREWRRAKALSQADLAERSGVTRKTIVSIETNPTWIPRPSTVRKLADALECGIRDLYRSPWED